MGKKDMADQNLRGEMDEARKNAVSEEDTAEEKTAEAEKKQEKPNKKEEKKKTEKKEESKPKQPSEAEKLQKDLDAAMDAHMRTLAEYDNYRKRTTKEKEAAYGDAKAEILKSLLPILDNINRSLQNEQGELEAYKKGVNMIFTSLSDALNKAGLEEFGESGDQFDPKLHNAVMHVDDENLGDEVVTDVFSKGYKLGDRILRPAMVKVAN